ncbi:MULTISPECIES: TadE/TadG family type IV pilus assembly protein [Caballeronia]|jgi:Flp pilus assembly protein TadG|uniref:TadE/TadG family type IV pilus assembly protein n=1 Tax=Caballeronia TaxID=1827195 RepID=UPI001EF48A2A|nr:MULTISPECIES: TadE/TadG family type IV pilus assembly protein [Caballeronia]MCG7399905.1 pilus assembly protein [Caballeronia zhejiangensis]MDR5768990.1 pilus assembly protein [Caballeronia sp. LZ028]
MKPVSATMRSLFAAAVTRRARSVSKRLMRSERGAVTIEFVIVVPVMLLILLGFTELYLYMRAVSLVEHTAFTLADSIGQMSNVIDDTSDKNNATNANSLTSIWAAAVTLAQPNTLDSKGGVIITAICDQNVNCNCTQMGGTLAQTKGTPAIMWSAKPKWQPTGMTSSVTATKVVPSNWPFRYGDSAVAIEVFYRYTPFSMTAPFWRSAPGETTIYERVFVRPRNGQVLALSNPSSTLSTSQCESSTAL